MNCHKSKPKGFDVEVSYILCKDETYFMGNLSDPNTPCNIRHSLEVAYGIMVMIFIK